MIIKYYIIFLITFTCYSTHLFAMLNLSRGEDQSFFSKKLPTEKGVNWLVKYRVILPKGYRTDGIYSVVYFLHGRNGDRFALENLGILEKLNIFFNEKKLNFIIVAPECHNCYWMNAALKDERWGDVVTQELISDVEKKYSVFHDPSGRLLAGISMGGHGAIQLILNNPGIYGLLAAHSPVFRNQEEASRDFSEQFGTGEDYRYRDPFSLIIFKNKKINVPLWIDIGGSDFSLYNTSHFANLLNSKGVKGELHIGEDEVGGHDDGYWKYHLLSYLEWYSKNLK